MDLTNDTVTVEAADLLCGPPAPLSPAQAAAYAMPPMTDAECATVGRILAGIQARSSRAAQHGEAA